MISKIIAAETAKYTIYKVDLDPQFVIPIFYLMPLIVCVLLHKYTPKLVSIIVGTIFTASSAYLAFILYYDYAIWKFVMPGIVILGGLSGLSGWIRLIIKKIKNIGDDDSLLR